MPIMQYQRDMGTSNAYTGNWAANPDIAAQGAQEQANTKLAISPALQANQLKQERFNSVFPWLQNFAGSLGSNLATAGGSSGKSPEITVGGVWNPQQIQQQVNATRAQNDQGMRSQNAQAAGQTAGMGFGSHSPLLQALYGQNFAANSRLTTTTGSDCDVSLSSNVLPSISGILIVLK